MLLTPTGPGAISGFLRKASCSRIGSNEISKEVAVQFAIRLEGIASRLEAYTEKKEGGSKDARQRAELDFSDGNVWYSM